MLLATLLIASQLTPAFASETRNFPCGGGATYSVTMPDGVLTDGRRCTGALSLDSSVKVIGVEAFKGAKITSISFPESLELISTSAFENTQLSSVRIPKNVQIIGESAFAYNDALVEAIIPNTVATIKARAFNGARLAKIEIPSSVTKIEQCTFANLSYGEGNKSVVIPPSVTTIEGCAFWNSGITSVTLPNSLTNLAGFHRNKISTVVIPSSVTTISANAFSENPLLSVDIPNSVTSIGEWAFSNTYLADVVLPNSVKALKEGAFANNLRLKSISIPDNLEILGKDVFSKSPLLQTITYCGELTGFPVVPVCPPERREIIEKARAEKAAAELRAKQEAEARAKADAEASAKAIAEAQAKVKADLIGKLNFILTQIIDVENKYKSNDVTKSAQTLRVSINEAVAELSAFSGGVFEPFEERIHTLSGEYLDLVDLAKVSVAPRTTTITCAKGKVTKKVTGVKPKCPKGYKKK